MQDVRRLPVEGNDEVAVTLDELAREGARRMIAAALEAEAARSRLAPFVRFGQTIRKHRDGILASTRISC